MNEAPDRVPYPKTPSPVSSDDTEHRVARTFEWLLIAAIVLVYGVSFGIKSPVNGLGEVGELFDQDSRYIISSLAADHSYQWNPQNHLLYHWLTEMVFRSWQRGFGGGTASAFLFLKLFTAATGLWFLLTLRVFLREVGLGVVQRLALLPLAGMSLAVWFHFAAFETSGLTMPPLLLFLIAFLRRARRRDGSLANHVLLIGSLLVAFWTRSDQWFLPVAAGVSLLLPQTRGVRRSLAFDLTLFAAILPIGYCLLASSYFHISVAQAAGKLIERHDRPDLAPRLMNRGNLTAHYLLRVARANALYSLIMPIADDPSPFSAKPTGSSPSESPGRRRAQSRPSGIMPVADHESPFSAQPNTLLHSPLSFFALLGVGGLLVTISIRSLRRLASGDVFHAVLWTSWIVGTLFYTWFNPHEPFLWILQFGVLEIAALADTWPPTQGVFSIARMVGVAVLVVLHNTVFFWLRYR